MHQWIRRFFNNEDTASLPPGAFSELCKANPRLNELRLRYEKLEHVGSGNWSADAVDDRDLRQFRKSYLSPWRRPGHVANDVTFALSYLALKLGPARSILDRMTEDGAFGARTINFDGRLISRDLITTARDIEFLQTHAGLGGSNLSILDIGSRYGRLAHGLHEVMAPEVSIAVSNGYARTTFQTEYYLRFRNADRVNVIPADELSHFLSCSKIDIASNFYSFSEERIETINWWVKLLAENNVRFLMITPNGDASIGAVRCRTDGGKNMETIFERYGYRIKAREPRYPEPIIQRNGLSPVQFNLFELS